MRHDAEVHACSAANPTTDVSCFVRTRFRGWRSVSPRAIGGSIGNQIDPGASLLPNTWRHIAQTLRCNSITRIVSGAIPCFGLYIRVMTSGAGIIIPPALGLAVEFSGREFDAKVVRECRPNPVADGGRTKCNSSERKRSDLHGFPVSWLSPSYTAFCDLLPESVPCMVSVQLILDEIELASQTACNAVHVRSCELMVASGVPSCDSVPKVIDARTYSAGGRRFRSTCLNGVDHTHPMAMP